MNNSISTQTLKIKQPRFQGCLFLILRTNVLKLRSVELGVETVLGDQLLVISLLNDLAVAHNEDAIGVLDRVKTVSNDKGGSALHQLGKRAVDLDLRTKVD